MNRGQVRKRLLVVDDDPGIVTYLIEMLTEEGFFVQGTVSPMEALDLVGRSTFDLVISDIEMPELRGTELLTAIQARNSSQLVLLITAFGSIDLAMQAVRAGACDFITKPFRIEVLVHAIKRALRERQMRREIVRLRSNLPGGAPGDMVARSPSMIGLADLARRAARTSSTVLITGESGTGKGHLARFIHDHSPRSTGPFMQINCAALPAPLVESELFGVKKGAYTDARDHRSGLFVEANGGTLFLDEVGEMPIEVQPKLLQFLETRKVRPVGASTEVEVDVRVIAATNRPLEDALKERRFRPDLYYRLNVIRAEIPPLRERPEDIESLVDIHLQRASVKLDRPILGVSAEALRWLISYDWPGNVRELSNMIERAVALTDHDTIVLEDLNLASSNLNDQSGFLNQALARGWTLADVERAYIRKVLDSTGGNKLQAARILGIDRRTLYRKAEDGDEEAV